MKIILNILILVLPVLIAIAYITLAERKILSSMQRRKGPNVVGVFGLLQPLADAMKLLAKETVLPSNADVVLFIIAPILTMFLSLLSWTVIPFDYGAFFTEINVGILYLLGISSLGVYGIIIAGWSSNSKYAFLGALRSTAQMVSYELTIGFSILTVGLCAGSLNLIEIVQAQKDVWYFLPLLPLWIIFFISSLAETNRHPFDLPEAEAELVSGYNVEYSAIGFTLFFLGEYGNILLISTLNAILFLGGWYPPLEILDFLPGSFWLGIKTIFYIILFVVARGVLPRYRYDQLMRLGWKVLLPFTIAWFILTAGILISFNWLP
jgi:NADH-quinone oxidoreductase subunit H